MGVGPDDSHRNKSGRREDDLLERASIQKMGVWGMKMTAALLDRMTHRAHILLMNGDSYRFHQSLQRQREPDEERIPGVSADGARDT